MEPLKVTNVTYKETFQGLAYQCETNYKNILICNDGNGGATYVKFNGGEFIKEFYNYAESYLEALINKYELTNIIKYELIDSYGNVVISEDCININK